MTKFGPQVWPAYSRRLAFALCFSVCAHAALFANVPLAPGLREASLFTPGRPLAARLAPAIAQAVPEAFEPPPPPPRRPDPEPRAQAEPAVAPAKPAGLPSAEIYFRGSEVDERAMPLNEVILAYPERALAKGQSGVVTLRLKIDHQGVLRDASVVDARPNGVFENAALEAVLALKFRPALRNGVPVASVKTIEVPFYPDCMRTGSCIAGAAEEFPQR